MNALRDFFGKPSLDLNVSLEPDNPSGCFFLTYRQSGTLLLIHAADQVIDIANRLASVVFGEGSKEIVFLGCPQYKIPKKFHEGPLANRDKAHFFNLFTIKFIKECAEIGFQSAGAATLGNLPDCTSILFKRTDPVSELRTICLGTFEGDQTCLYGADDPERDLIAGILKHRWTPGIKSELCINIGDESIYQVNFRGWPFLASGERAEEIEKCFLEIISRMMERHWRISASGTVSGDTDSIFFVKEETDILPTKYALVVPRGSNRIRFHGFSEEDIQEITHEIREFLTDHDLKNPRKNEIVLKRNPFQLFLTTSESQLRQIICQVLTAVTHQGWQCVSAIKLDGDQPRAKSVFLFKQNVHFKHKPEAIYACIALYKTSHLRFVNFPPEPLDKVLETVEKAYLPGTWLTICSDTENEYKKILHLHPWNGVKDQSVHGQSLMLQLISVLDNLGWTLTSSADVSSCILDVNQGDPDSLFFCRKIPLI